MVIPPWVFVLLAAWVIVFGSYRVAIAIRRTDDTSTPHWKQKAAFGRTKRAHLLYGIAYLVLGVMLIAMAFGVTVPLIHGCSQALPG